MIHVNPDFGEMSRLGGLQGGPVQVALAHCKRFDCPHHLRRMTVHASHEFFQAALEVAALGHDGVVQSDLARFPRRKNFSGKQQAHTAGRTNQPHQIDATAPRGSNGQSAVDESYGRVRGGETVITGERKLGTAAQRNALQTGNDGNREVTNCIERALSML